MERRPLYGGDRGIQKRSDEIRNRLRLFAKSDFKHDFGENIDTRDKYTSSDLQRFVEISERYGLSKTKALISGFNNVINKNPYFLLKDSISSQIYPETVEAQGEFVDEEAVMSSIGMDYGSVKRTLKLDKTTRKNDLERCEDPARFAATAIQGDDELRNYTLSAVPLKINQKTANIASAFYNLSQRKKAFALIIDAAGGLSLTSIKNTALAPVTADKITFYILENIENDSDSATKLKHVDKDPKSNVTLFYLREVQQSVVYPPFELLESKAQGENLYGNARLILSRVASGETEADFVYPGEEYHIENVSQNANVKNASLNVLAAGIAGRVREAHLYPYLKRVGDWCQALSLLDTSRVYDILDEDHNPTGQQTTLQQLEEQDVEIGLVTLDRILLAYALNLGLNVFFTTGSDLTSLLYFKNDEIQLSPELLQQKVSELRAQHQEIQSQFVASTITDTIRTMIPAIQAITEDVAYLQALRSLLSNVSMMRFDFDSVQTVIANTEAKIQSTTDNATLKQLYTDAIAFRKKYAADNSHNLTLVGSIGAVTYPDFTEEAELFTSLRQERPSRNTIAKLKTIISTKMYDDAEQCKVIFGKLGIQEFPNIFRSATSTLPQIIQVFVAFKPFATILGKQIGGGPESIQLVLQSIRNIEVTPVSKQVYDESLTKSDEELKSIEESRPPVVVDSYMYRDEKLHPYTICDNYIVTRSSFALLANALENISHATTSDAVYIALRFLILYNDILQARYERLSNNEEIIDVLDEDGKKIGVEESDVNYTEHKRLHLESQRFLDIVLELKQDKDFVTALQEVGKLYQDSAKWTNDTVDLYMSDARYGVRNNNFERTFAILQTTRDSLLKRFRQRPKGGRTRRTKKHF